MSLQYNCEVLVGLVYREAKKTRRSCDAVNRSAPHLMPTFFGQLESTHTDSYKVEPPHVAPRPKLWETAVVEAACSPRPIHGPKYGEDDALATNNHCGNGAHTNFPTPPRPPWNEHLGDETVGLPGTIQDRIVQGAPIYQA